jgi:AcrR family transcriptional regulator
MTISSGVDTVNTRALFCLYMVRSPRPRPQKKPSNRYHHGDLRRALLDEAIRTIQSHGVEHLTLRTAGERLGVSRTALYRHFSDKQALLAAVGREGFHTLRQALSSAWEQNGRGRTGFEAMAGAYVGFAVAHPSHYRVMFGRFLESAAKDTDFIAEAEAAFQVLVDALIHEQKAGIIRQDDPVLMARFVWAVVHGIAMLAIDGQLREADEAGEALTRFAVERIRGALAA